MRVLAVLVAWLVTALAAAAATEVQPVTSPGGVAAWLVRDETIPLVTISLHFEGGAVREPDAVAGVTDMMVSLMDEAAGDLDFVAYAERREALPMRFSLSAGRDGVSLSATILKRDMDACLEFLAMTLGAPRFDDADIERLRPRLLSDLASRETDPNAIAGAALRRALFGDHPFGREVEGTAGSIEAITRDDIVAAHERAFSTAGISAAAVGDLSPDELGAALDRLLGGTGAAPAAEVEPAAISRAGTLSVIDFDSSQSLAYFGHRGLTRDDPDFLPAYVANFILGGWSSQARLGTELRRERGLTYGINTFLRPNRLGPMVLGSISTPHDRMAEAIDVIREQWRRMADEGVSADELETAKRYLIGSYALGFDSNEKIASTLIGLQRAGLPPDYIYHRDALIAALSVEDVNAAARRLFHADELAVVVVGRPVGLVAD